MNHNGDNSPSMDFDELRRRHEEFKQRQGQHTGPAPQKRPSDPQPVKPVEPVVEDAVQTAPPQEVPPVAEPSDDSLKNLAVDVPEPTPIEPEASFKGEDDGEHEDEDYDEDESAPDDGSNPFNSILTVFKNARGKLQQLRRSSGDDAEEENPDVAPARKHRKLFGRKKQEMEEFLDYDDSDYADEDYVQEEFPPEDEAPASDEPVSPDDEPSVSDEPSSPEIFAAAAPVVDIEDITDDPLVQEGTVRPEFIAGKDDENFDDEDFDDEDYDDGDFEDYGDEFSEDEQDESKPVSGFKRFLNLFIVREEDDAPVADHEDENSETNWNAAYDLEDEDAFDPFARAAMTVDEPAPGHPVQSLYADTDDIEGGSDMDENNKLNLEMTEQLASSLETQGMTRRERRELAERRAAEEAAKKATEEAAKRASEEAARAAAEEAARQIAAASVAEPSVEPSMDDLFSTETVEPASAESSIFSEPVDEPTREFKPLSKTTVAAAQAAADPIDDDDDDDEEDDEDEDSNEKSRRFSLFGRKKSRDDEDDEDEDEDDVEDDEDEDDEETEAKSHRGLFAKKSHGAKYDEDDEDDDEDDDDEYDEYDEYDDEDDDEGDYDDYDDDDDGQPLSHHIIGFFKWLFFIILMVLLVVFALNFLDFFNVLSLDNLFEKHYNKAPGVFDTLFPSHNLKQMNAPGETISAIDPLENEPTAAPSEEPVVTAAPSQAPVVATNAPESSEAPASTDAPASSDAPAESGAVG